TQRWRKCAPKLENACGGITSSPGSGTGATSGFWICSKRTEECSPASRVGSTTTRLDDFTGVQWSWHSEASRLVNARGARTQRLFFWATSSSASRVKPTKPSYETTSLLL